MSMHTVFLINTHALIQDIPHGRAKNERSHPLSPETEKSPYTHPGMHKNGVNMLPKPWGCASICRPYLTQGQLFFSIHGMHSTRTCTLAVAPTHAALGSHQPPSTIPMQPGALKRSAMLRECTSPRVIREHAVRREQAPVRAVVQRRIALAAPECGAAGRERILPGDLRRIVEAAAAAVPSQALRLQGQQGCCEQQNPFVGISNGSSRASSPADPEKGQIRVTRPPRPFFCVCPDCAMRDQIHGK